MDKGGKMQIGAIIVAAGRGTRAGGDVPKQWRRLEKLTVAEHAMRPFCRHSKVSKVVLVANPEDIDAGYCPQITGVDVVAGGETRSASVRNGLAHLEHTVDAVLIHDAARPCVTEAVISHVIEALSTAQAAAPAVAVVDALWTGQNGQVTGTVDRTGLFRAQTPQGFILDAIIAAHREYAGSAAADVEIARKAGMDVVITPGDEDNLKITTPGDFARAEAILRARHGH